MCFYMFCIVIKQTGLWTHLADNKLLTVRISKAPESLKNVNVAILVRKKKFHKPENVRKNSPSYLTDNITSHSIFIYQCSFYQL